MSVKVIVDRKMGTYHPEHPDLYYPINYGYIPDVQDDKLDRKSVV